MATVIRNNVSIRNEINRIGEVDKMPTHIQQMLYEIQLKAGIPQKLMEMQGLINDETTKKEKKENE